MIAFSRWKIPHVWMIYVLYWVISVLRMFLNCIWADEKTNVLDVQNGEFGSIQQERLHVHRLVMVPALLKGDFTFRLDVLLRTSKHVTPYTPTYFILFIPQWLCIHKWERQTNSIRSDPMETSTLSITSLRNDFHQPENMTFYFSRY